MAVTFVTALVAVAASRVSRHATSPAVVAAARAAAGDDAPLIAFRHFDPTLAFYARSEVPVVHSADDLRSALVQTPAACIVTRDEFLTDLAEALGNSPEVVTRRCRFLQANGEVIVARPPQGSATVRRDVKTVR
jgi:hypothetical protein